MLAQARVLPLGATSAWRGLHRLGACVSRGSKRESTYQSPLLLQVLPLHQPLHQLRWRVDQRTNRA
jgi:hypothetical protein